MAKWRDFDPGDPLPSNWTDAMEELLSSYAGANFRVEKVTNTTIHVAAGPGDDQVGLSIDGRPRYITATITATHPGGSAGDYDVYCTTHVDTFGVSGGHEIITSNMNFGLRIGAPTGVGEEALSRKVATVSWDGVKITSVRQIVGGVPVSERPWEVGDCKPSLQPSDHPGWVLMDGRSTLLRSAYPVQFVTFLTGLGFTGNGVTTFGVPDMRGRTWVGQDSAGIRIANAAKRDLTETGGSERIALSYAESGVPPHGHGHNISLSDSTQVYQNADSSQAAPNWPNLPLWQGTGRQFEAYVTHNHAVNGGVTAHAGTAATSHDNMMPYFVGNWFVFTGEGASASSGGTGGGGGIGSLAARIDNNIVTAALADSAEEAGAIDMAASSHFMQVASDRACRVRLYMTAAARDADAARAIGTDPADDSGVILEVVRTAAGSIHLSPQTIGSNFDTPPVNKIYYRVQNRSGAAAAVTVTLTNQPLEVM